MKKGFTLTELLIVIGVLGILLAAVVYLLNPGELFNQGRDGNRIAGLGTLDKAVSLYYSSALENPSAMSMGTSSVLYVSIPDPAATSTAGTNCAGLGLPATSTPYHCAAPSNYLKTDGTGWVPINFTSFPSGSTMSSLPIDPTNTTSSGEYYIYMTDGVGGYEIIGHAQSPKDASDTADFIKGTNLALLGAFPSAIAQNLWIADYGNGSVDEYAASASTTWKNSFDSAGGASGIYDIALDKNGNIWGTTNGYSLQEYSASGTLLGTFGSSGTGNGQFNQPEGIAIDASGNIWVSDQLNNRVEEFSATGTYLFQIDSGTGNSYFNFPVGIAFKSNGDLLIADDGDNAIKEFTPSGVYVSQFGSYGTGNGQFQYPFNIALDASGNVWVTDFNNDNVQEFAPNGTYITGFGSYGTGNGQFNKPTGIAIDASGNIWVADSGNNRIEEFSPTGAYLSQFGTTGWLSYQFQNPYGLTIH